MFKPLETTTHHTKLKFSKGVSNVVRRNDGKSLAVTTSKQTRKVFNFRPSLLSSAPTNESKGRNEDGWGGTGGQGGVGGRRRERPT